MEISEDAYRSAVIAASRNKPREMLIPGARVVRTLSVPADRGAISRQKKLHGRSLFRSRRTRRQGIKDRSASDPTKELHERENRGTEGTQGAVEEHSEPENKPKWSGGSSAFFSPLSRSRRRKIHSRDRRIEQSTADPEEDPGGDSKRDPEAESDVCRKAASVDASGLGRPRIAAYTRL